MARLDDELGKAGIGLVKVDVEGFEKEVLRGGAGMLERSHPIVVFEYHQKEDAVLIPEMLKGYVCSRIVGKETIMLCRPKP